MEKKIDISIIGGDNRQIFMANILIEKGFSVAFYGLSSELLREEAIRFSSLEEILKSSRFVIAPIPMSRDKKTILSMEFYKDLTIENLLNYLDSSHMLFAGDIDKKLKETLTKRNIEYYDFMEDTQIAILNSIATAEGTIMEAIRKSNINLYKSNCLVLGYGKCATILAKKLHALDAHVCVATRSKESLTLASTYGYMGIHISDLKKEISRFDYIFNTIPARILTKELLNEISKDATIIDIASSPGGVDYETAKILKLNAHLCLGIPGKYCPKASGGILVGAMLPILKEKTEGVNENEFI